MKYRVVTFQSEEVVNILRKDGVYYADKELSREKSFDESDFIKCGGHTPIWVFQHPLFCLDSLPTRPFCDALECFRCEMSVSTLSGFYMIELLLDYQPPKGAAHNSSSLACVIPSMTLWQVAAVYKVEKSESFYFYEFTPVLRPSDNALFKETTRFTAEEYDSLPALSVRLHHFHDATEYYDKQLVYEMLYHSDKEDKTMKRVIYIVPDAPEEWLSAIKVLLEKLGVTYSNDDAKKFCSTPRGDQIVVTYSDVVTDKLLDNMDKCYYLNSTKLEGDDAYAELSLLTGLSGEKFDSLIDKIYASIPALLIDKNLSKAANALVYYPTWVNLQH